MAPRNVNWVKVEKAYRAGVLPITKIAAQAGISDSAIHQKAKKYGWLRDLTARVRERTAQKLTEAMAGGLTRNSNSIERVTEDEETVEQAALTQVAVVREHADGIRRGLDLTTRLMHELDVTTTRNDDIQALLDSESDDKRQEAARRAVSLPARAAVMRDLAQAARVWINLERQAFRISDDRTKEAPSIIENMTEEELRDSILKDIIDLKIEIPKALAPPKTMGVVPKKS